MKELLEQLKNNDISLRQFIARVKQDEELIQYTIDNTSFLNEYNPDILERLYYIINDLHEIVRCKYCNNKAIWSGRIKDGYKDICSNKECRTKQLKDVHTGNTSISDNRDNAFIEWQNSVITINDDIIIENIKYGKYVDLITNPALLYYLDNRFKDSSSRLETLQRIRLHIEQKPLCPICGNPVSWVGKKNKLFTTYCSNTCAGNSKDKQEKIKNTLLEHWGTANCYDSPKYKALMKEKYGVEYTWQREDIKEKRRNTLLEKYGTTSLFKVDEIREKIINTTKEHYGVNYVFQIPEIQQKAKDSVLAAGVGTSHAEDRIYEYLNELNINAVRFYESEEYPYKSDFYLPDYNIYIEYQGSQYHHRRAFLGTKEDKEEIDLLIQKDKEQCKKIGKDKSQYMSMINVWANLDVKKRTYAKEHNINLLEIYSCNSAEDLYKQIMLFRICLNKENPYNIGNEYLMREFNYYKSLHTHTLSKSMSRDNLIIKHFMGHLFYKNEISLYGNDPIIRRKIIQNRMKYLNKKENELTVNDIFTGFKKTGIYYGYSHFNPEWTNWFITKFGIKSVYDPCGGWGHHMLGMLSCDEIIYNDISKSTCKGVQKIKDYFNIEQLEIHNNDGAEYIPNKSVDAWFMCPPYYNLEKYESDGFESEDAYKNWLNTIFENWYNTDNERFGLIIREDFFNMLDDKYKSLVNEQIEINANTTHFTKSKKYKEYFYIFEKK